jgi:hypothetical protein
MSEFGTYQERERERERESLCDCRLPDLGVSSKTSEDDESEQCA